MHNLCNFLLMPWKGAQVCADVMCGSSSGFGDGFGGGTSSSVIPSAIASKNRMLLHVIYLGFLLTDSQL